MSRASRRSSRARSAPHDSDSRFSQCDSKTISQSVEATSFATLSRRAFVGAGAAALGSVMLSGLPGSVDFARRAWADQAPAASTSLALDMSAWNLDADNGVWWQVGVPYCANPATLDYETLGIYVPQAYMTGAVNNDGRLGNPKAACAWQGHTMTTCLTL